MQTNKNGTNSVKINPMLVPTIKTGIVILTM